MLHNRYQVGGNIPDDESSISVMGDNMPEFDLKYIRRVVDEISLKVESIDGLVDQILNLLQGGGSDDEEEEEEETEEESSEEDMNVVNRPGLIERMAKVEHFLGNLGQHIIEKDNLLS